MSASISIYLLVCPLVFLAGLVDSIAGGGGLISLPAYLLAGVPPHMAIGTNKLSSFLGTIVSTIRYYKNRYMDLPVAAASVVFALIGSSLGSCLSLRIPEGIVSLLLLFVLPIAAFFVLKNKDLDRYAAVSISRRQVYLTALIISFLVGGYDGFYGPGAGTFYLLLYTRFSHMDAKTASGNTKLVNLSSNFAALIVFLAHGKIVYPLGLAAAVFCILGNYIGSGLVLKNGQKVIRPVILLVLLVLFIKIITTLY